LEYLDPAEIDRDAVERGHRIAYWINADYEAKAGSSAGGVDKSQVQQAIVAALMNNGLSKDTIQIVLQSSVFWTHYQRVLQEKGFAEAERSLERSWASARDFTATDSPEARMVVKRMEALEAKVNSWQPAGRTERTDKNVMLAHIAICKKSKRDEYFLSSRGGSELACCTALTFSKSTRRIISDRSWLVASQKNKARNATYYRIVDENFIIDTCTPPLTERLPRILNDFGVFEHKGLGGAGRSIYEATLGKAKTIKEIAHDAGVAVPTAYKKVPQLLEHNLLRVDSGERHKTRYLAVPAEGIDFKALGQKLKTRHILSARRANHVRERDRFRSKQQDAGRKER
jgi:hypothetical protein